MHQSNTFLHTVVHDIRVVCAEKLELAKNTHTSQLEKLTALSQRMERVFSAITRPELWEKPISSPPTLFLPHLLAIGMLKKETIGQLEEKVTPLLNLLEEQFLGIADALESMRSMEDSSVKNVNLEICQSLLKVRDSISDRLDKFETDGNNMRESSQFMEMKDKQGPLFDRYFHGLMNNTIEGKRQDAGLLDNFAKFFQGVPNEETFFHGFGKFTTFIEKNLPAV